MINLLLISPIAAKNQAWGHAATFSTETCCSSVFVRLSARPTRIKLFVRPHASSRQVASSTAAFGVPRIRCSLYALS